MASVRASAATSPAVLASIAVAHDAREVSFRSAQHDAGFVVNKVECCKSSAGVSIVPRPEWKGVQLCPYNVPRCGADLPLHSPSRPSLRFPLNLRSDSGSQTYTVSLSSLHSRCHQNPRGVK